ncbi:MAG: hypothetical protein AB7U75_10370 [Hyphomicrobiaceae bacterium]
MAFPKIEFPDRKIILLSGFERSSTNVRAGNPEVTIADPAKLIIAAQLHRDAIAFGYVQGRWVPAA